ncbi:GntR family transcriptional regulator / MocR family aminotransferase [Streptomyces aidingensis]|uniref:GntR family transcriptional regulator / MocR family aminotransferase n=1 Tax=Streptomyces aidingensis TaxID=910347 RepID=A0A1I1RBU5_9ACTN|nr:GntR family transcriptional regulator / MocR family aminotransferase [Streptomyces aidingensis]
MTPRPLYRPAATISRSNRPADLRSNLAWSVFLDLDAQPYPTLRDRLAAALRAAIRSGRLAPGSALPPSRTLATELRCSRWAVTEAYGQLVAEGHLVARTGSATRVREVDPPADAPAPPAPAPPAPAHAPYDLTPSLPDLRAFPNRRWLDALRSTMVAGALTDLAHPPPDGNPRLRGLVADYLRRGRDARAEAADVLITGGVTDGVLRVCRALRGAGFTALAVEDPGWPGLRQAAAAEGLEVIGVPVDEEGLRVDLLARHPGLRAVLVAPGHQFPSGAVLSPARREALLAWARETDGVVLEDDSAPPFRYAGRPTGTLQGRDADRVFLLGSTSKTLAPGIGIGWLLVPRRWASVVQATATATDPERPSGLWQATMARFMEAGAYDRHLRATRGRYRLRRAALVRQLAASLPEVRLGGADAGLHLVAHLPAGVEETAVVRRLGRFGVRLAGLDNYRLRPDPGRPGLVIGYGNLPDAAVPGVIERITTAARIGLGNPVRNGPAAVRPPP